MESMEYDSDSGPDNGPNNSPMQHSGWESGQKVVSYVRAISAFRGGPSTQSSTSQPPVSMLVSQTFQPQYSPQGVKTPKFHWNTCRNVFSAVSSFSGFRASSEPLSPQEQERSMDLSDEDSGQLNNNEAWFKGMASGGQTPSELQASGSVSQSVPSVFGGMFSQAMGANSGCAETSKLQDKDSIEASSEHDSMGVFNGIDGHPGNRKLSKRLSMPAESFSKAIPKHLSLDPNSERSNRRTSLPPGKLPKLSEETYQHNHRPRLRSLCKPGPAKKRKICHERKQNSSDESPPKSKLFTFRSFLLLNVVIGICLSVYTLKLFHSRCAAFSTFDAEELTKELNSKVYGQHIATKLIPHLLDEYLTQVRERSSPKPLVISLHGWTGVGKNYISKIVSDFFPYTSVNKLLVPLHFAHEANDELYAQEIPEWIKTNVTQCHVNFVIFDEMDKASDGVINGLNDSVNSIAKLNVSNLPVIYLLLSNSKGAEINKLIFELTSTGRPRTSITQTDIHHVFQTGQALWYTKLVSSQIIDAFVPFLPLEKGHIVQCIKKDLVRKGLDFEKGVVTDVVREMSFFKLNSGKEFSHTGCKRVSDKVNLVYNMFDDKN